MTFAVSAGGGSASPSTDTSDALGHVDAHWTVGTAANAPQEVLPTVTSAADQAPQPEGTDRGIAAGALRAATCCAP